MAKILNEMRLATSNDTLLTMMDVQLNSYINDGRSQPSSLIYISEMEKLRELSALKMTFSDAQKLRERNLECF